MTHQVGQFLTNLDAPDKDIRFMALSDCLGDLEKDALKLDEETEKVVRPITEN